MTRSPTSSGPGSAAPGEDAQKFRRASLALFLAGFASFSMIYCVQALLPEFAKSFDLSSAQASLALSVTTGSLAIAIMVSGAAAMSISRRKLMFASILCAGLCNLAAALVQDWGLFLVARALEGFMMGGVPAVALVYVAEEVAPRHLGQATGLYVAGTAFGAMFGRLGVGLFAEIASWQTAMAWLGGIGLVVAFAFLWLLPPSRRFVPGKPVSLSTHLSLWIGCLRNPRLLTLYAIGFMLTSIFVTLFSYSTFRLSKPPYGLSPAQTSLIFLTYGLGMVSSSIGGRLIDRWGRRSALLTAFSIMLGGVLVTLWDPLPVIVVGIGIVTIGFFIGHAAASTAVGQEARAAKSHGTSLYLLFYYFGASVIGTTGGLVWDAGGWPGVVAMVSIFSLAGMLLAALTPGRGAPGEASEPLLPRVD